jgi:hypothetical protein
MGFAFHYRRRGRRLVPAAGLNNVTIAQRISDPNICSRKDP